MYTLIIQLAVRQARQFIEYNAAARLHVRWHKPEQGGADFGRGRVGFQD
jgi:hypothetical protein